MKEFKGTKGEWYLQEYTDAYTNIIRCCIGNGFNTLYLASTGQNSSPETRENARLMAASLDLLQALQECMSVFESAHLPGGIDFIEYKQAKAAINKALGEQ